MKNNLFLILPLAGILLMAGCGAKPTAEEAAAPPAPSRPGVTVLDEEPEVDDVSGDLPAEEQAALPEEEKCGLENCHGLDVTCGPNVPDFCTMEYQLGDFCRQYAICEVIGGECQLVPDPLWDDCRDCVAECEALGGEPAFECEQECRELIS